MVDRALLSYASLFAQSHEGIDSVYAWLTLDYNDYHHMRNTLLDLGFSKKAVQRNSGQIEYQLKTPNQ